MGNHVAIHDQHPASPEYMGLELDECSHCFKTIGNNYGSESKPACARCHEELEAFRLAYYEEEFHPGNCQICKKNIIEYKYCRVDSCGYTHLNCAPSYLQKLVIIM